MRVVVAVAAVAAGLVLVREVIGCTPPGEQADMIDLFKADPLFATAPAGGQLVDEYSRTYSCDSGLPHGSSPTGPGFAEVMKLYTTPGLYQLDQLRRRFDQPAAAAGWRVDEARGQPEPAGGPARVVYCKEAGGRASNAVIRSTFYREVDPPVPAVKVVLSASRDDTECFLD